jgi:hypothetical protein
MRIAWGPIRQSSPLHISGGPRSPHWPARAGGLAARASTSSMMPRETSDLRHSLRASMFRCVVGPARGPRLSGARGRRTREGRSFDEGSHHRKGRPPPFRDHPALLGIDDLSPVPARRDQPKADHLSRRALSRPGARAGSAFRAPLTPLQSPLGARLRLEAHGARIVPAPGRCPRQRAVHERLGCPDSSRVLLLRRTLLGLRQAWLGRSRLRRTFKYPSALGPALACLGCNIACLDPG